MTNVIVRYPARGQAPEIFALRLNNPVFSMPLLFSTTALSIDFMVRFPTIFSMKSWSGRLWVLLGNRRFFLGA